MEKKGESISLIDSFAEFKDVKNIDRVTLMSVLEDVFRNMLQKRYGTDENFDIIINTDKGDLEIWRNRVIVADGEVEDENAQISLSDAQKIEADYEIGEEVTDEVKLIDFGRRSVLALRQNLSSRIMELEKASIYEKYKDRVGQIIVGEVYQVWKRETLVLDEEGNELILKKEQQIPADYYKKGDTIKAVVSRVEMKNSNPYIELSRTSPLFLERLFENEVPEIFDGLITVKKVVRIPGERAKVAVESYDDRIDPVGACVGMKGSRIHGIVRELRNENIDVINYTTNLELYITRALNPAKIDTIEIDEENKQVNVYLQKEEVSLAIGKSGYNIQLASKLIGYQIDVYRITDSVTEEEDIRLDAYVKSGEIDEWIVDELNKIGCDYAKSVLALSEEELESRTDLEVETIRDVLAILKKDFEEESK
ncbi:MAG: transcription termination/antitermination protein NusA [Odoribacter sp.]|nr:transcription termination/antitermination protein NusA [Bacteroidales bacterium]MBR2981057.1 transcription termination/antitermination protein NusA [Odoribacter sp.]